MDFRVGGKKVAPALKCSKRLAYSDIEHPRQDDINILAISPRLHLFENELYTNN